MAKKKEKWTSPGWKIEPQYIEKVLIGNWFEEREQLYRRRGLGSFSTNRLDYVNPGPSPVAPVLRRKELALRNWEGVGRSCLTNSNEYKSNLITNHIVDYQAPLFTAPTPARKWNSRKSSWIPEKLDRPLEEIQLPRLLGQKKHLGSGRKAPLPDEKALSSKKPRDDDNQCPPINIPRVYSHEPVMIKYRHRNTDVTPFFPVILRNTSKNLVVKWNM